MFPAGHNPQTKIASVVKTRYQTRDNDVETAGTAGAEGWVDIGGLRGWEWEFAGSGGGYGGLRRRRDEVSDGRICGDGRPGNGFGGEEGSRGIVSDVRRGETFKGM